MVAFRKLCLYLKQNIFVKLFFVLVIDCTDSKNKILVDNAKYKQFFFKIKRKLKNN